MQYEFPMYLIGYYLMHFMRLLSSPVGPSWDPRNLIFKEVLQYWDKFGWEFFSLKTRLVLNVYHILNFYSDFNQYIYFEGCVD